MDRKILIFKFVLILVVCRSDVFRVISGLLGGRWDHTFSYLGLISITYCGSTCFTLSIVWWIDIWGVHTLALVLIFIGIIIWTLIKSVQLWFEGTRFHIFTWNFALWINWWFYDWFFNWFEWSCLWLTYLLNGCWFWVNITFVLAFGHKSLFFIFCHLRTVFYAFVQNLWEILCFGVCGVLLVVVVSA